MIVSDFGNAAMTQPYAIFARAQAYWVSARYPKQLTYGIVVSVWDSGTISVAHYNSSYDARTETVRVDAVSDEERAHPYTPHGVNFFIQILNGKIPASAPQRTFDYLGVPILAPNYSFGLRSTPPITADSDPQALVGEIRREFHDPEPHRKQLGSGLKTIAAVTTLSSHYVIRLVGVELVDGHSDYHLSLQPVREPQKYRLRDVWVDTASFATDKLITQGNFAYDGMTDVPWTVSFKQINGATYIFSETTDFRISVVRHHYDAARITFENIKAGPGPGYAKLMTFGVNSETGVPPLIEP